MTSQELHLIGKYKYHHTVDTEILHGAKVLDRDSWEIVFSITGVT